MFSTEIPRTRHVRPSAEIPRTGHVCPSTEMPRTKNVRPSAEIPRTRHVRPSAEVPRTGHVRPSSEISRTMHIRPSAEIPRTGHMFISPTTSVGKLTKLAIHEKRMENNTRCHVFFILSSLAKNQRLTEKFVTVRYYNKQVRNGLKNV